MSAPMPDGYVLTFGETMALMSADRPGPLAHAGTMRLGIGGSESNVAIGLARLGVPVVWAGRVGDDALGRLVVREIAGEGVLMHPRVDDGAPTGLMLKERRTSTTQAVTYYRSGSAGSRLSPDDVPHGLVSRARLVHLTGITPAISPSARETVGSVVSSASADGVPVSFDLNYRSALWSESEAASFYRALLPSVDVVFAGEDEAGLVVPGSKRPVDLARALIDLGARDAVIKLGASGALAIVDGEVVMQDAVAVDAIDTVGAGDAFVAGFLAERLGGRPVRACLETAVATGAFACLVPGDWEGFPRRDELSLLQRRETVSR